MAMHLLEEKGVPLDKQEFDWSSLVQKPYSKLDDDAFTRVRVILMNGIEAEALRFSHSCARMSRDLRVDLARVRRVEQHQQTLVNWLHPADQTPLETTIGFEQTAIEVTARVALQEPDEYLKQVYRFGMLEDFDHLYRYASLYDRVTGKDAAYLTQGYSDILPGRPTSAQHRHPDDDLREPYRRDDAAPITKLNALTITAAEHMTHDFYMTIGPMFSDPIARKLYAEIASIEEQHVTQYESLTDPSEGWLEKWLLHEACEVYNYYSCMLSEPNPRIKKIWEMCVDYELGHLQYVSRIFEKVEKRDVAEILPKELPDPIAFESHRDFVRETIRSEAGLRTNGTQFVPPEQESEASQRYRGRINAEGSPSDRVSAGYSWRPGTELAEKKNGTPDHVGRVERRS